MELSSVLDVAIPALIIFFFLGLFYIKLKEPIDLFFSWIGRSIRGAVLKGKEASESVIIEDVITY